MTPDHFRQVYEKNTRRIDNLLLFKGKEYATDTDRLVNFKESAKFLRTTPMNVCLAFLTKHLTSIVDMVKGTVPYTTPQWDEKVGDAITYLHLLWALEEERRLIPPSLYKDQDAPLAKIVVSETSPSWSQGQDRS